MERDFRACLLAIGKDEWTYRASDDDTKIDALSDVDYTAAKDTYDAQEYARKRKSEYDKLNQFEMQFDDLENGTTTWPDAINEIKMRYPK